MFFRLLQYIPLILSVFVCLWLVRPLPWPALARVGLSGLLLLCGAKMLIIPVSGQYLNALPLALLVTASWGFMLVCCLGLLGLLWAIIGVAGTYWWPAGWLPTQRFAIVGTLALLIATYGIWQGLKVPILREHTIVMPQLPKELEGYYIAVLTDLHASAINSENWMRQVVWQTNAAKPDLIVLVGDMVDGQPASLAKTVAPLKDLVAPNGVFYVPGNHEYYSGLQTWMRHFETLGLRLLSNEHVILSVGKATVSLAGIADPAAYRYASAPRPNAKDALAGIATGPNNLTVLLAHQPMDSAEYAALGPDLQISGHTHGGSVLGLSKLVANFNNGFLSGEYTVDKTKVFVSPGAGIWGGVPFRLGVPSEISLLRLTSGKS